MIKINWSKFKGGKATILSLVDLSMILLVIINLTYIVIEWGFTINFVNDFLKEWLPMVSRLVQHTSAPQFLLVRHVFCRHFHH